MINTITSKQIKELILLDELLLITENHEYRYMRESKIEDILDELISTGKFTNLAGVPRIEYNELTEEERNVVDSEVYELLYDELKALIENPIYRNF